MKFEGLLGNKVPSVDPLKRNTYARNPSIISQKINKRN